MTVVSLVASGVIFHDAVI